MIQSACCYGSMSASLHVNADEKERRITVGVRACGFGRAMNREFPADKFGEALDLYHELCAKMEYKNRGCRYETGQG